MAIRTYKLFLAGVEVAESENEPELAIEEFKDQLEGVEEGTYELVIEDR